MATSDITPTEDPATVPEGRLPTGFVCKLCYSNDAGRRYTLRQHQAGSEDFTAVRCAACGLFQNLYDWRTAEREQREEKVTFVETSPGELWESERELDAHRNKARQFAAALEGLPGGGGVRGKRILEIGCRRGFFLRACLDLGAKAATGQEFFRSAPIEYARQQLGLDDVRTAPFEDRTTWPDGEFDVVCSFDVLEHVHDLRAFLAETVRLCRPGGLQFHATPGFDSITHRTGRLLARTGLETIRPVATSLCNLQAPVSSRGGPHVSILSSTQLPYLEAELGLVAVDVRYVNSYTYSNRHYAALIPVLNKLPAALGSSVFGVVRRVIRNKLVVAARVTGR